MTSSDERTQVAGSGGGSSPYPGSEMRTEVVGTARPGGGASYRDAPYRGDETMIASAKQRQPSFAFLVITKGRRMGDILHLNLGETSMGRESDNDIIIDDDYGSRRHAKVKVEPDPEAGDEQAFFIYDLATPNGTFVDGEQILRAKLVDGAKVQIGETVMVFKKV